MNNEEKLKTWADKVAALEMRIKQLNDKKDLCDKKIVGCRDSIARIQKKIADAMVKTAAEAAAGASKQA